MLIYFVICVFIIVNIYCSDTGDTHNEFLKGSADYRIEYSIGDNDIEMISEDQMIPFKINDTVNKFRDLNKMCKREYYRTIRSRALIHRYYKGLQKREISLKLIRNNRKGFSTRGLHSMTSEQVQHSRRQREIDEYNYEALLDEYYTQAKRDEKSNETYHAAEMDPKGTRLMKLLKWLFKLNTKIEEQSNRRQSREVLTDRIWKISQIWLVIYFIVAIPLWCTLGWCCCCFCCKSLKAHETINDARKYMIWNPPGILRDDSGDIFYEPSKKEIETYEELEHLIKTL